MELELGCGQEEELEVVWVVWVRELAEEDVEVVPGVPVPGKVVPWEVVPGMVQAVCRQMVCQMESVVEVVLLRKRFPELVGEEVLLRERVAVIQYCQFPEKK